ncbi:prolyl oligopeptidase family serine peptidase [Flavobacterium sp. LHD-85]|uniref:prolyl oligopeptidase family serine peptidase n=1 Tax=Flavobacterium sp. LHD-85 TaxID=3071410 RepID=UPI0027DFA6BC|nr:prolyl oligopeptidase family serine peptidase [Flavobacterium sp. LHD-85]MDQ6531494.1 prolyl oligopeptidase family serine peptidase [Flavobacterium sp. LHD-85]
MIRKTAFALLVFITSQASQAQYKYPTTPERPVVDDYFGTKITDSYRWLEDMNNPEVQKWFKDESDYTNSIVKTISGRDDLFKRMKEIQALGGDQYALIRQVGDIYYYTKNKKNENIDKLYLRKGKNGTEILLIDPTTIKKGATITSFIISPDNKKLAVTISQDGAEVCDLQIMDLESKKFLSDKLTPVWSEFPFEFTPDSKAITYTQMVTRDNTSEDFLKNMKSFLHIIGTDSKTDKILASKENNPELGILSEQFPYVTFSNDYAYIILNIGSTKNEEFSFYVPFSELGKSKINWKPLIKYEDEITGSHIIGDKLFFLTHKNAPNYKLAYTSIKKPNFDNATILVPENDKVIRRLRKSKNFIYYNLSDGINQEIFQVNAKTLETKKIPLPVGSNGGYPLNPHQTDDLLLFNNGWVTPSTDYDYNSLTGKLEKSTELTSNGAFPDFSKDHVVKEVEVPSHDGVMVPLSIIYPKNVKMDGSTSCFITGYGGYGISEYPYFVGPSLMTLLEQNTIVAFAHVRGGGEKGNQWHVDGMKAKKPNTWKDFIACSEYLIKEKFTSKEKLIGNGVSMGGVLIGRAITERPDLYKVALVEVGCTNTLRMETTPNGPNQIPEVGSLKNEEDVKHILEMDSQSKVKKGEKYPAVFIRTGINDPRVVPWEPGKFAAILQNYNKSENPILLHVNYANGHHSNDLDVTFGDEADMFAFALWQVGNPKFQIAK